MPWRDLLSSAQRSQLLALPTGRREIEEVYTLTTADRDFIATHRTASNRLGVAVQLCFLRHPGRAWTPEETVPVPMLRFLAGQLGVPPSAPAGYARTDQTRRRHFVELLNEYGWRNFGVPEYRELSHWLRDQARGTDQGLALVTIL